MKPPSPDDVAVKIDGVKVPRDKAHGEGWDYDADMSNVVIYGQACEQLKGVGATQQRPDHLRLPRHHHRVARVSPERRRAVINISPGNVLRRVCSKARNGAHARRLIRFWVDAVFGRRMNKMSHF